MFRLYKRKETDWRNINWVEIAERFDGFTPQGLSKLFKAVAFAYVPSHLRINLNGR